MDCIVYLVHGRDPLLVSEDVGLDGLVLFGRGLHRRKVETEVVGGHEPLVLGQPGFAHTGLAVEPGGDKWINKKIGRIIKDL